MATTGPPPVVRQVVEVERVLQAQRAIDGVGMDPRLAEYIVRIVTATRRPVEAGLPELEPLIEYGASPRGTITLALCSRAEALLEGRDYVTPKDVKRVALDVLRHRVAPTYEAEAEGRDSDAILSRILEHVAAP
jgi:MoxR-like ATPase